MKTKLTLLFLFGLSLMVNAQIKFVSSDKNDMRVLADSIAANAKRLYVFDSERVNESDKYFYSLKYLTEDNADALTIGIKIIMVGKNTDLEIEGTPEYYLSVVYGNFLDLFPFWSRFIDDSKDAETVSKSGRVRVKKYERSFIFERNSDGKWGIIMRKY
jgi:hypothetical protein